MKSLISFFMVVSTLSLVGCQTQNTSDSSLNANQERWCHVNLTAADQTLIAVDYRVHYNGEFKAAPIWVNVRGDNLDGSQNIRATLITKRLSNGEEIEVVANDLEHVAGQNRYTKNFSPMKLGMDRFQNTWASHEIVVAVDGSNLQDPFGGVNFKFSMSEIHKSAACHTGP